MRMNQILTMGGSRLKIYCSSLKRCWKAHRPASMMACMYKSLVNSEYTNSAHERFTHSAPLNSALHISFFQATQTPECFLGELIAPARQPVRSIN